MFLFCYLFNVFVFWSGLNILVVTDISWACPKFCSLYKCEQQMCDLLVKSCFQFCLHFYIRTVSYLVFVPQSCIYPEDLWQTAPLEEDGDGITQPLCQERGWIDISRDIQDRLKWNRRKNLCISHLCFLWEVCTT